MNKLSLVQVMLTNYIFLVQLSTSYLWNWAFDVNSIHLTFINIKNAECNNSMVHRECVGFNRTVNEPFCP